MVAFGLVSLLVSVAVGRGVVTALQKPVDRKGSRSVIPLAVVWGGYQLLWYGYSLLRGPGMGFADLLLPSRVAKADSVIATWGQGSKPVFSAPNGGSYVNGSTQLGSIYNPAQPKGGIPTKPVLGNTPPAGYSG